MTKEQIRALGQDALQAFIGNLRKYGYLRPLFRLHRPDGKTHDLIVPEGAEALFNSFTAKETLFRFVRMMAEQEGSDAVALVSDQWVAKATPKAASVPADELERLMSERGYQTAVERGIVERREALNAIAQTESDVLLLAQFYHRASRTEIVFEGEPVEQWCHQTDFKGATKMFGELYPIRPQAQEFLDRFLSERGKLNAAPR